MIKKKKANKKAKLLTKPKKFVDPVLARARNLRSSLLRRSTEDKKHLVPTVQELEKWLRRDLYLCHYSLEELTLETLQVDHKRPVARGGENTIPNLCFASESMNRIKGSLTEEEFRSLLELVKDWDEVARNSLFRRLKMGHF